MLKYYRLKPKYNKQYERILQYKEIITYARKTLSASDAVKILRNLINDLLIVCTPRILLILCDFKSLKYSI